MSVDRFSFETRRSFTEVVPVNIRASFLGFGLAVGSSAFAIAQDPPATPPMGEAAAKKPETIFRGFRDAYIEGKYDVAADLLREYLNVPPSETELIELDKKYGATFILGLRNLKQWSDNPTIDANAKKTVEELVTKIRTATQKTLQDPKRLTELVRNLGATPGEKLYAEIELKRAGAAAVPAMIEVLRSTSDVGTRTGILGAMTKLGMEALPPMIASLDGLSDELKTGMVNAIGAREDVLSLVARADTDPQPHLWAFASKADTIDTLKSASIRVLETINGNIGKRKAADELVRLSMPLVNKKAAFWARSATPGNVTLWSFDSAANNVKSADVTTAQAEEYFGLRNLKWAVERAPADDLIQSDFLAFATSRAAERAKYADLNSANPTVASLLAAAPKTMLFELLGRGLTLKDTGLALGSLQAISARASTITGKPDRMIGTLVKAMEYADDRVQFAAAVALLRSGVKDHGSNGKIVEILKRAASADAGSGASRAILADPGAARASRVSEMFRQAGFDVERVGTTRDILRRVNRAADIDLIVVDQHASEPLLVDFLSQLRSSPVSASIPVIVVASDDQVKPPSAEPLLLRLALLIAATETEQVSVPQAFMPEPRRPAKDNERARVDALENREKAIQKLFDVRLPRLQRLVSAANFPESAALQKRMAIRLPQLTYAALAAEYPVTPESAPEAQKKFDVFTKLLSTQQDSNAIVEKLPVEDLVRLVEQLEQVLTPETQKKFDAMNRKVDVQSLLITGLVERNPAVETRLNKQIRGFTQVRVMGEPYSASAIDAEVNHDAAPIAKSAAEKAIMAKTALEYLKKFATGEIAGYDVRPADAIIRSHLKSDDLAHLSIDALAAIGSAEAQQDLIATALTASRPQSIRMQATDAAIRNVAKFGKSGNTANLAGIATSAMNETVPELKSRFAILHGMLASKPNDLVGAIQAFSPSSLMPAAPKVEKPKDAPMGDEKKPMEGEKKEGN